MADTEKTFYDNPENLSPTDILMRMRSLGSGTNRDKRFNLLASYNVDYIAKEEYIRKYCNN